MPIIFGFWILWTGLIINGATHQANKDIAREEFKYFKDAPHKYQLKNIPDCK